MPRLASSLRTTIACEFPASRRPASRTSIASCSRAGCPDLTCSSCRAAPRSDAAWTRSCPCRASAEFIAKVGHLTRHDGYTTRQTSYDLSKLRGKGLTDKPGRTRRYHVPPDAARTIAALLVLRNHVIAPILAGVRSPRMGRKPKIWTPVDRDYENLRTGMQTLFLHVGIATRPAAA